MRFIDPIPDEALDCNSGERLAPNKNSNLPRIPVPHRRVEDRDERAEPRLNPGVAKIKQIQSPQALRLLFRHLTSIRKIGIRRV
jgi:hypothetical protein